MLNELKQTIVMISDHWPLQVLSFTRSTGTRDNKLYISVANSQRKYYWYAQNCKRIMLLSKKFQYYDSNIGLFPIVLCKVIALYLLSVFSWLFTLHLRADSEKYSLHFAIVFKIDNYKGIDIESLKMYKTYTTY